MNRVGVPANQPTAIAAALPGARPRWFDRDRLRRIRNWQSEEFYARLVMRPLSILVMLVIADWKWVTPNLVTTAANVAKILGAALIVYDHRTYALSGVLLLQLGLLLDHLDGTIARYRRCGTTFGGFYDKVSDAVTWLFITAAVGWAAYRDHGNVWMPIAALASAYALLVRGYIKWLLTAERQKHEGVAKAAPPSAAIGEGPPERSARDWAIWFASSLGRAFIFEEVDLFFWVGLGVLLQRLELLIWLLAITQSIGAMVMLTRRAMEAHGLDVARRLPRIG